MRLQAEHIQKSYGKHRILTDVSFTLSPGECVGIVGVNGCGKSTLLSVLSGIAKADGGSITLDEKSGRSIFRKIGLVPQDNPLIPDLSVRDNLKLWYSDPEAARSYLKLLGITPFYQQQIRKLSGGQKKRVSIAIAMASDPAILLLDEPGAALDLPCKYQIRAFLKQYLANGNSAVLTTHEEADLDLCSRLYLLKDGRLLPQPVTLRGTELLRTLQNGLKR